MQGRDEATLSQEAMLPQVERILHSGTFRNSDALRRLLRFLADKSSSGEADQLKEYSIAIDALGKPSTYDPRSDSTVRIQVGRLRQKLAEYYRMEGKEDPWIVELPKGRFKLTCEARPVHLELLNEAALEATGSGVASMETKTWRGTVRRPVVALLGAALLISLAWGAYSTIQLARERQDSAMFRSMWTPELEQLWRPFLTAKRPLIVSIADPPFVQFKGYGAYRDLTLNRWEDIVKSPAVAAIQKALNNPEMQRSVYYAPIGEVSASFLLGKLLGPRVQAVSLLRSSELSWQQLADNNVLYIGAQVFFEERLRGMPVDLDLLNAGTGIRNLRPLPGEPSTFSDIVPTGSSEDGEAYVLVTHIPGPRGTGDVQSFTSARTSARLAAVQWFTDEIYARILVSKLKKPDGEIPRYYQVVLNVKFKDGVPTETSYVLHHELQVKARPQEKETAPGLSLKDQK
jgi:hypothetical protein